MSKDYNLCCSECSALFVGKYALDRHMEKQHSIAIMGENQGITPPHLQNLGNLVQPPNPIPTTLREQIRKAGGYCDDKSCKSRCVSQLNTIMRIINDFSSGKGKE